MDTPAAPSETRPPPIRIFVVDDHALFTTILADVLESSGHFSIVGTANDAESALAGLDGSAADLVLLDLRLPGMSGLELLQLLRRRFADLRVVVCSGVESDDALELAFAAGAHSFVEKNLPIEELIDMLKRVARGETPLTNRAFRVIREAIYRRRKLKTISPVDMTILRQLARQQNTKQIAAEMGMSLSAIYKARRRISQRTGAWNTREMAAAAANLGLIDQADFANAAEFTLRVPARRRSVGVRSETTEASSPQEPGA